MLLITYLLFPSRGKKKLVGNSSSPGYFSIGFSLPKSSSVPLWHQEEFSFGERVVGFYAKLCRVEKQWVLLDTRVCRTGSRLSLPVGIKRRRNTERTSGTLPCTFAENWSPCNPKGCRCWSPMAVRYLRCKTKLLCWDHALTWVCV